MLFHIITDQYYIVKYINNRKLIKVKLREVFSYQRYYRRTSISNTIFYLNGNVPATFVYLGYEIRLLGIFNSVYQSIDFTTLSKYY